VRLELDDEQVLLKRTAEDFSRNELEPFLARFPEAPLPRDAVFELMRMVKPFGILSARLPRDAGGTQMPHVALGLLYEAFPAEVSLGVSSNDVLGLRLHSGGSTELKERYLPPLIEGEIMAGSCISEPDAGSDITSIGTRATSIDGDRMVVNGSKVWSSHASIADVLLVAVSGGKDKRGRSIVSRLLVDTRETDPSSIITRDLEMIGLKRHHLCEVTFVDCVVPRDNLVGDEGDGVKMFTLSWLSQRAVLGLIAVHLAQEALTLCIDYVKQRRQFGRAIGTFQLIQAHVVDMATLVETARYLCYKALYLLDQGRAARLESSMAKFYATEAAVKVTNLAIQVHGAIGLSCEHRLEKLLRDARMLTVPDGTTEIQKLMVGREILGLNAIR
jgi:alkylation response protein AidB-like acyl-CoA dehydrogenase